MSSVVPSTALTNWRTTSSNQLEELVDAHARVGGTAPGRRYATSQLNASLVVQVAAHFQLYCRDLHSEAAQALVSSAPASYRPVLRIALTSRRGLDRGNASVQTISTDFARFDLDIWAAASTRSSHLATRRHRLEQLNAWRNAIAHQDFLSVAGNPLVAGTGPTLEWARRWRTSCTGLAQTFDVVVRDHLEAIIGRRPW